MPPQTFITWPVTYDDKSEAKNNEVFATSSTLPPRCSGIWLLHCSTVSDVRACVISVSIKPGAIALDLIFLDPNSNAMDLVNPIIAAFDAE